jgi:hypothetical protein
VQTTKYSPVQARPDHPRAYRAGRDAPLGARAGRVAPLVLIEEHLTDKCPLPLPEPDFRKPFVAGKTLDAWAIPAEGIGEKNEFGGHFVAKLQRFQAGGYELSCRSLDLEKISNMMEGHRRFGKREKPDTIDHENIQKAANRAKRRVRLLTKNMGASHLVTFTRRETLETGFATPDQWAADWDRLRRMIVKVKGEFPYVAVLERHKKGNFHLHVAWVEEQGQKVNLNLVRGCWWAVLGARGAGNVDAQFIKVRAGLERADKVARYISKYTSKHFEDDSRFNKKRYWSSRQTVAAAERSVLRSKTIDDAREELFQRFGLSMSDYMILGKRGIELDGFFPFPDGSGFWLAFIPGKHKGKPPPF